MIKLHQLFLVSLMSIAGLAMPLSGHSQTYYLNAVPGPQLSIAIFDEVGAADPLNAIVNSTLSEVIYLDPVALTIRQVGTITFATNSMPVQFQESEYIAALPSPVLIPGIITVSIAANGPLAFDTGVQPMILDTLSGDYIFVAPMNSGNVSIPVTGAYSLVTGGRTNTGTFDLNLTAQPEARYGEILSEVETYNVLTTTGYPASIILDGGFGGSSALWSPDQESLVDLTATNGFSMNLIGILDLAPVLSFSGSVNAVLVATNAPAIASQPRSHTVVALTDVELNVGATGTPLLSYQWQLNMTNIPGATSRTLKLSNVVPSALGNYTVVVSNLYGAVASSNATLAMYPYLKRPFKGGVTVWGTDAIFSVQAWGSDPLSCQWFKDGSAIPNATNQGMMLTSIQFTNAGLYSVVLSNSFGCLTNSPAQVIVNPAGIALGLYPGVTISGVVGFNYLIQSTADLNNGNSWITRTNITLTQPVQIWVDASTDTSQAANPHLFYRVLPGS